jgi:hypothetical protein
MLNSPTEYPGTIGFIVQTNGGVLAIAGINLKVTVKHFEPAAVEASPVLKKICYLPAIPYKGPQLELEGKKLIDDVLRPMGIDTDALIGTSGYPALKAPRKFSAWPARHQMQTLNPRQGVPLMSVADEVMQENLSQWVEVLKTANKDKDFWGVALGFLPLYTELRDASADPDHQLDGSRIMWDVLGIVLSILPALGVIKQLSRLALNTIIQTASRELMNKVALPLVTRKILVTLMSNPAFTSLGMKGLAYAAYIGVEAVVPVPVGVFIYGIRRASQDIRGYIGLGAANGDSALSALYVTTRSRPSELVVQARAELAALGASTRVSVGADNIIVLRNSLLTPKEVFDENIALLRPLTRKQTVNNRANTRTSHSMSARFCAPKARRPVRARYFDCIDFLGHAHPDAIVEVGEGYTVYKIDNLDKLDKSDAFYNFKEFHFMKAGDQALRLHKANNNELAYKRLYAGRKEGVADVIYGSEKQPVIVMLYRFSGKSLAAIIAEDDRTAIEGMRLMDKAAIADDLIEQLRTMGIQYDAVNFEGVIYDSPGRMVRLHNFDNAQINLPDEEAHTPWAPLTTLQVDSLKIKFTKVFEDFIEQTKYLRPHNLGVDRSLLNREQLVELAVQRMRYEKHAATMQLHKAPNYFKDGKRNHRGIDVLGVDKNASELVLTTRYNELCGSADLTSLGALSGFIENTRTYRVIHAAIWSAAKYSKILNIDSCRQILAPQAFWLTAAGAPQLYEGRCYPLVLAVAVAVKQRKVSTFFMNVLGSAAKTDNVHNEMIRALDQMRTLESKEFLMPLFLGAPVEVKRIVRQVTELETDGLFAMDSQTHSMLVGISKEAFSEKVFYFYDPNVGIFNYTSPHAFSDALEGTLGTIPLGTQYGAWNQSELPLYKMSLIQTEHLKHKVLTISNEGGSGPTLRTVAGLSEVLEFPVPCVSGLGARQARSLGCTSIEYEMNLMHQVQQALMLGELPPPGSYQRAMDFGARLTADYPACFAQGLDLESEFAPLEVALQQLLVMDEAAGAVPGVGDVIASADDIERRIVYFNYLTAIMEIGHRINSFNKSQQ